MRDVHIATEFALLACDFEQDLEMSDVVWDRLSDFNDLKGINVMGDWSIRNCTLDGRIELDDIHVSGYFNIEKCSLPGHISLTQVSARDFALYGDHQRRENHRPELEFYSLRVANGFSIHDTKMESALTPVGLECSKLQILNSQFGAPKKPAESTHDLVLLGDANVDGNLIVANNAWSANSRIAGLRWRSLILNSRTAEDYLELLRSAEFSDGLYLSFIDQLRKDGLKGLLPEVEKERRTRSVEAEEAKGGKLLFLERLRNGVAFYYWGFGWRPEWIGIWFIGAWLLGGVFFQRILLARTDGDSSGFSNVSFNCWAYSLGVLIPGFSFAVNRAYRAERGGRGLEEIEEDIERWWLNASKLQVLILARFLKALSWMAYWVFVAVRAAGWVLAIAGSLFWSRLVS